MTFDFWFKGRNRIGLTGKYTSSVGGTFINPASEHIGTGITQSPAGKRQAAAVVKIMFNGNLFLLIGVTVLMTNGFF
ncbi:hypothetical protein BIQ85_16540 [Escherichia coli]|nr:hypothetical protein BIQ85_16540 [Escherichia coli]